MCIKKDKFDKLKKNYKTYLPKAEKAMDKFVNDALCFHKCTLQLQKKEFLSESHIDFIYKTLEAWGMNSRTTHLVSYVDFCNIIAEKILPNKDLSTLRIEKLNEKEFEDILNRLTAICFELEITKTKSKIVASTKTLAHIFPNLVPPMDSNYTKNFFATNWYNGKQDTIFKDIMRAMRDFYSDKKIVADARKLVKNNKKANTSLPKVFDNLIITYMNEHKNK